MGYQHIADALVHLHGADCRAERVRVGCNLRLRKESPDMDRLQEGQQIDLHRAVPVCQPERSHPAVIHRGQMDAAALHQPPAEGEAFRGVVVAADEEHLITALRKTHQEIIQQRHRLGGRHRFVVDVPGDQNAVRTLLLDDLQDLGQDMLLILQHGKLVDPLA